MHNLLKTNILFCIEKDESAAFPFGLLLVNSGSLMFYVTITQCENLKIFLLLRLKVDWKRKNYHFSHFKASWRTKFVKSDFHVNLSARKILEFSHCVLSDVCENWSEPFSSPVMSPSGCNGNQNNFANKEECETKCRLHLKPETRTSSNLQIDEVHDPICALPSETGPCRAMKPRYYYNSQKQKCERYENVVFFIYKKNVFTF